MLKISILLSVISLFAISCKPDKPLTVIDPCKEYNDLGGIGFKILESPTSGFEYETDTIFEGNSVIFQANPIYLNVQWKIAYDPRLFTNKRQLLRFTQLPTNLLPVTMIGFRKLYPSCVPSDDGDGYDTITKYFFIVDSYGTKVNGSYFGRLDQNISDTNTLRILHFDYGSGPNNGVRFVIKNFPRDNCGNSSPYNTGIGIGSLGYKFFDATGGFSVSGLSACKYPNSNEDPMYIKGFMPTHDSLIIDLKTTSGNFGSIEKWYKWRGRKL